MGWVACVGLAVATIATATSAPGPGPWETSDMSWNVYGHDPSASTATLSGYVTKSDDPGDAASSLEATGTAAWSLVWDGTMHDLGCGFDAEPCHHPMTSNLRNAFGKTSSHGRNRETSYHVDLWTSNGPATFVWRSRRFLDCRHSWRTPRLTCFQTKLRQRHRTPNIRQLWHGPSWRHRHRRQTRRRQNL